MKDIIAARIRSDIMQGNLRLGQQVPERTYAQMFEVSRTPVREAVVSLASLGLIRVRAQSGSYVLNFSRESLADLFRVRFTLESAGPRLANEEDHARLVRDLRQLYPNLDRPVRTPGDYDAFNDVDTDFHTRLVEAGGSPLLLSTYAPISAMAQAARSRLARTAQIAAEANAHHHQIIERLAAQDICGAEAELKRHLDWVVALLLENAEIAR